MAKWRIDIFFILCPRKLSTKYVVNYFKCHFYELKLCNKYVAYRLHYDRPHLSVTIQFTNETFCSVQFNRLPRATITRTHKRKIGTAHASAQEWRESLSKWKLAVSTVRCCSDEIDCIKRYSRQLQAAHLRFRYHPLIHCLSCPASFFRPFSFSVSRSML